MCNEKENRFNFNFILPLKLPISKLRPHAKANYVWECGNSIQYCAFRKELAMVLPALSNRGQDYRSARMHPGSNLACFLLLNYPHAHTQSSRRGYICDASIFRAV